MTQTFVINSNIFDGIAVEGNWNEITSVLEFHGAADAVIEWCYVEMSCGALEAGWIYDNGDWFTITPSRDAENVVIVSFDFYQNLAA